MDFIDFPVLAFCWFCSHYISGNTESAFLLQNYAIKPLPSAEGLSEKMAPLFQNHGGNNAKSDFCSVWCYTLKHLRYCAIKINCIPQSLNIFPLFLKYDPENVMGWVNSSWELSQQPKRSCLWHQSCHKAFLHWAEHW